MSQNYPNPFTGSTRINYQLRTDSVVRLAVYDVMGRMVEVLVDARQTGGPHSAIWMARDRSAGIYFYRLDTDGGVEIRQMILTH